MYCISITELTVFISVGSISLPWSPKRPFYFLTLRFLYYLMLLYLGLPYNVFIITFFNAAITLRIQIKMATAETSCHGIDAKRH